MSISDDAHSLIKRRRAQMLIHSELYYVMDESVVSDDVWQRWANELVDLQKTYGTTIGFYDKEFADWDGSTGCHLIGKDRWVTGKAHQLLRYMHSEGMHQMNYSDTKGI